MSGKLFYIISVTAAFSCGVFTSFVYTTKTQMDSLLQPQAIIVNNKSNQTSVPNLQNSSDLIKTIEPKSHPILLDACKQLTTKSDDINVRDFSSTDAKAVLDSMPDVVLAQYVDKLMAKGTSDVITNKREFAERAVEELYKKNDSSLLQGEIKMSFDSNMPNHSVNMSDVPKMARLYAHLDTFSKVPNSPYVFVKWVDNSTGQILLFEKKDIQENSNTNWVNMQPYDGWHTGSYDVKFYQFTSSLEPIAQLTYTINSVIE